MFKITFSIMTAIVIAMLSTGNIFAAESNYVDLVNIELITYEDNSSAYEADMNGIDAVAFNPVDSTNDVLTLDGYDGETRTAHIVSYPTNPMNKGTLTITSYGNTSTYTWVYIHYTQYQVHIIAHYTTGEYPYYVAMMNGKLIMFDGYYTYDSNDILVTLVQTSDYTNDVSGIIIVDGYNLNYRPVTTYDVYMPMM